MVVPHLSNHISPFIFFASQKGHLCDNNNEGMSMQVNHVIDESHTIGLYGTKSLWPNTVISMLHHYLSSYSVGKKVPYFIVIIVLGKIKTKLLYITCCGCVLLACMKMLHLHSWKLVTPNV